MKKNNTLVNYEKKVKEINITLAIFLRERLDQIDGIFLNQSCASDQKNILLFIYKSKE
jgi:hypothetical protein